MRHHPLRIVTLAAVLLCFVALTGHSGTPKQIMIEARFVEASSPEFDRGISHYPYLQTDSMGGLQFKTNDKRGDK